MHAPDIVDLQELAGGVLRELLGIGDFEGEGSRVCKYVALHRDGPAVEQKRENSELAASGGLVGKLEKESPVRFPAGNGGFFDAFPAGVFQLEECVDPWCEALGIRGTDVLDFSQIRESSLQTSQLFDPSSGEVGPDVSLLIRSRAEQSSSVGTRQPGLIAASMEILGEQLGVSPISRLIGPFQNR
jgi:hypothetical protein